ncbi:hypothetical protein RSK20926_00610 [Roseobacter sp. SK209-2-6]|uniref:hypothetical protein n=1 Tax=Roseobacter sp. SK209-2-6 TaxID=388739 RepID=UPI0000F3C2C3|nr:hypothetical protein [Roseobacter sp. SK209-2-6]EBA15408.1 hypothetical protein RSK20926_00610 [Roseobacter sp. SK209-2-6]
MLRFNPINFARPVNGTPSLAVIAKGAQIKGIFKLVAAAAVSFAAATAAVADTGLMTKFDDIQWTPIEGTPMSLSNLWGDRDSWPCAMYLKMPDGFAVPDHANTYAFHGDACISVEDCVLFIFQDGKGDAIFHSE